MPSGRETGLLYRTARDEEDEEEEEEEEEEEDDDEPRLPERRTTLSSSREEREQRIIVGRAENDAHTREIVTERLCVVCASETPFGWKSRRSWSRGGTNVNCRAAVAMYRF